MSLKKIFGDFLVMTRSERNGALVLIVLILLVITIRVMLPFILKKDKSYLAEIEQKIRLIEQQEILESHPDPDYSAQQINTPSASNNISDTDSAKPLVLFDFNPNTVTKKELSELGFSGKVANTIINYRAKGGIFRKKSDLLRVYGLDSTFYMNIESYITIPADTIIIKRKEPDIENRTVEKKVASIEINSADSAEWTMLPGIGPVFAKRICSYRKSLGGFVTVNQLKEVYNFSEETYNNIYKRLTIDASNVITININFADITELKQHPYCNFETAKKITDYRSRKGSFSSVEQLLNESLLDSMRFHKLAPYLRIE